MKLWCVDYNSVFGGRINSKLFFELEAAEQFEDKISEAAPYTKIYRVDDIWNWSARNCKELMEINLRNFTQQFYLRCSIKELKSYFEALFEEVKISNANVIVADCGDQVLLVLSWYYEGELHTMTRLFYKEKFNWEECAGAT